MEKIKKTILQALTTGLTQGYWNATTNVPDIITTGITGYMWYVSVSGNTVLGDIDSWNIGDWAVKSTGSTWGKVINNISGSSGNTLSIPDLIAVYHMKIGLKQDSRDIGFFDIYETGTTIAPTTTTTTTSTSTTTTSTSTTTSTTTEAPYVPVSRTMKAWFTSYAPTTYTTRRVYTSLDGALGVGIEVYYAGFEVADADNIAGAAVTYSEFMTEADSHKIIYTAGVLSGNQNIDDLNDYSAIAQGYFTFSSGIKIRDLGDSSTYTVVDANPLTNEITLSNGDTLNFKFYNSSSGMPKFGVSPI